MNTSQTVSPQAKTASPRAPSPRAQAVSPPGGRASRAAKRCLDLLIALPALAALAPLLLILAVAVRFLLGSPVLFRQVRPGLRERPFQMVKFRSMTDALDRQGKLLPDRQRLTGFGRWMRRWSLDELPGLWHVVRGEMSLVGPRPLLMHYLKLYDPVQRRRHEVTPGLTGWAQVNGRNALSWEEKLGLDVWYVDHWSVALDCRILARTLVAVLRKRGISSDGHSTMPQFCGSAMSRPGDAAWPSRGLEPPA